MIVTCRKCRRQFDRVQFPNSERLVMYREPEDPVSPEAMRAIWGVAAANSFICPVTACSGDLAVEATPRGGPLDVTEVEPK